MVCNLPLWKILTENKVGFKMKKIIFFLCFLSFPLSISAQEADPSKNQVRKELAIVIDDFGNNMKGTEEMLNLPVPITVAIMPFLSTSKEDAIRAHKKGHEVIVHLPLEPKKGKKAGLDLVRLQRIYQMRKLENG